MPASKGADNKIGRGLRVLVVDDSPSVRARVVEKLRSLGFGITEAGSGEEALAQTLNETFDLVVSDIQMGSVTGVQLCRVLRSDPGTADLPIVLLTASTEARTRFWGRNAGANVYLAKQRMDEELIPAVTELMKDRAPRAGLRPHHTGTPLERVSAVLDQNLFDVVVAAEVRRLMDHVHDRVEFGERALQLAAEVIGAPYLVLQLLGPGGPTYSVRARGPWPSGGHTAGLAALAIPEKNVANTHTTVDTTRRFPTGENVIGGRPHICEIRVRDEKLGELRIFGGSSDIAEADVESAELVANSLGIVLKSLFLMEETQLLALTDGLTGLYNRRHATLRLAEEIARAKRGKTGLCVAMCDVDHFKAINDEYGHGAGDRVLQQMGKSLREYVRRNDIVARWGGEEFLVIFSEIKLTAARIVAERLRGRLAQTRVEEGPPVITVSIGLAMLTEDVTAEELIEQADQALYRAKARGRNRVEMSEEGRVRTHTGSGTDTATG